MSFRKQSLRALGLATAAVMAATAVSAASDATTFGPFNADFPQGGDGLSRELWGPQAHIKANAPWSLYSWVKLADPAEGYVLLGGFGDAAKTGRFLGLKLGKVAVWTGSGEVVSNVALPVGAWRFVAAVCDGVTVRLYVDGREVASGTPVQSESAALMQLAPRQAAGSRPFGGKLAGFTGVTAALTPETLKALAAQSPNEGMIVFDTGAPHWPVQTHQMYGQVTPQDAWTLPKSGAPFSAPVAKPGYSGPALVGAGSAGFELPAWTLAEAPKVAEDGAILSKPGYNAASWYVATVPGTVLQTLIDRGVYPNPDYGLNNMAIPESLNKQDYWYRTEFVAPADFAGKHTLLTFNGVNYAAEVWLNGEKIGTVKGAFIRGQFDVTGKLKPGAQNALAVKVSPPPHPGLAQEESLTAGVGENGGMLALDGPTFVASEGWDWIPSVRDRDTGLWQGVTLKATGDVRLLDPHIITRLPKADNSEAKIDIEVPVENLADHPVVASVEAAFDGVKVTKTATIPAGKSTLKLSPSEFAELTVKNPKLWWPNGYGAPDLHRLRLSVAVGGATSDVTELRFGIRQITYELSLFDSGGHLRRVEVDLTKAHDLGQTVVDGRHETIKKVPGGWAASLTAEGEHSPAVTDLQDTQLTPYLVIKVNGVRIAARGGAWGTDDWLKRSSRDHLEPFFRLHQDAHVNVIRNWIGQNTEEVFYDLADEYGLLVLNDFWDSTQDYNIEPQDPQLFLDNAADVMKRFRNHPSIAMWFGRNEGVPQPILNEGLQQLSRDLDGTRYYSGSSNRVNLQDSGPYNYREPDSYFTTYSKGFAVEVGSPSFPTLEAWQAAIPAPDRWPVSDVWAYHDWHPSGNGATKSFEDSLALKLGAPTSLEDFERKAQLLNFETYRAIFEGMNAELWTKTSGRLLWMTQPAWPSSMWQILSHDYDTHAAFYGFKKAGEPVHIQLNAPDHRIAFVNNTVSAISGAQWQARVYALDGKRLQEAQGKLDLPAGLTTQGPLLGIEPALGAQGAVFVRLDLQVGGKAISQNGYWLSAAAASMRKLSELPAQPVAVSVRRVSKAGASEVEIKAVVKNRGKAPSLNLKLTLLGPEGERILPVYYSDNYISLAPGEGREITVRAPAAAWRAGANLAVRGWNAQPITSAIPGK